MDTDSARALAHELLPVLRRFTSGAYGIALGGSGAKGIADAQSDLDLYVFVEEARSNAEREALLSGFSSAISGAVCWGQVAPTVNAGSDFRFRGHWTECWLRDSRAIARTIAECREGVVRREFVVWTPNGFSNHCALSDLKAMLPLEDPDGLLADWKAQVATYPPRLREALLREHLGVAGFWPGNFHYRSAVEREDVVYTSSIVQQVVHSVLQVLFALNEVYFPGDKRLEEAVARLPVRPGGLPGRLSNLLAPSAPLTREGLRAQSEALGDLVREVQALAGA